MAILLESLLPAGRVAFVLCEVQESVIGDGAPWPALTEAAKRVNLIGNAARIAEAARARGAPVIHCTAEGPVCPATPASGGRATPIPRWPSRSRPSGATGTSSCRAITAPAP